MSYIVPSGAKSYSPPIEVPGKNTDYFGTTTAKTSQLAANASSQNRALRLLAFWATNVTASDCWVLFFDSAAGGSDVGANAVPSYPALYVPAGLPAPLDGGSEGLLFREGIYLACSSTPEKLTLVADPAIQFHADLCV